MLAKIVKYILIIVNALAAAWLLLCHIASYIDTSDSPSLINVVCFSLPFAVIVNFIFPFIWLIFTRKKKKLGALISVITILISWNNVSSSIGWKLSGHIVTDEKEQILNLRIMTYNVHLFNLGEWTKDKNTENKILNLIKEVNPDILCLQEFYMDKEDSKEPYTELISNLGYPYIQFTEQSSYKKKRIRSDSDPNEIVNVGIAVFSKYPLENKKDIQIDSVNSNYKLLTADVQIENKEKFHLIVCHLQSSRVGSSDISYIDQVKAEKNLQQLDDAKTKGLIKKVSQSGHFRAKQANIITHYMETQQLPIIICGDFNDVPGSYVYNKITQDLDDPFRHKGWGFSNTYKYIFPTLRIDHILYDPSLWNTASYEVIKAPYSDHYPVVVNLSFKK